MYLNFNLRLSLVDEKTWLKKKINRINILNPMFSEQLTTTKPISCSDFSYAGFSPFFLGSIELQIMKQFKMQSFILLAFPSFSQQPYRAIEKE